MKIVVYAYFFALDFFINILYTILFASIWFLIVSDQEKSPPLGSNTLDSVKSTLGPLTSTKGHIVATPIPNPLESHHASLVGEKGGSTDPGSAGSKFSSLSIIFFWLIKIYFVIIVFSYAQNLVVRSHLSSATFSSNSGLREKAQRRMLSGNYWREDDDDYKLASTRQ